MKDEMKVSKREIILYYNPNSSIGRQTLANAETVTDHLQTFSFFEEHFNETIWLDILDKLKMNAGDLVDTECDYYKEHLDGADMDNYDWIKLFMKKPELIKAPIAISGNYAVLCINPRDVQKLETKATNIKNT